MQWCVSDLSDHHSLPLICSKISNVVCFCFRSTQNPYWFPCRCATKDWGSCYKKIQLACFTSKVRPCGAVWCFMPSIRTPFLQRKGLCLRLVWQGMGSTLSIKLFSSVEELNLIGQTFSDRQNMQGALFVYVSLPPDAHPPYKPYLSLQNRIEAESYTTSITYWSSSTYRSRSSDLLGGMCYIKVGICSFLKYLS